MTYKLLIGAVVAVFCLTACGGGGSGNGGMPMRPPAEPPPQTYDTQSAFGAAGDRPIFSPGQSNAAVTGTLRQSRPAFGSVAINLYTPGLASVRSVETTFTGNRFTLAMRRQNGTGFTLDTNRHYAEVTADSTTTRNPVTNRPFASGYMIDVGGNRLALAGAGVEWSNTDVTDYLAIGYWMTVDAGTRSADMGAFVDGTAYPTPSPANYSLPVTGTATYRGAAGGFYITAFGPRSQAPGATEIAEYEGRVALTANFGTMQMSGRVDQITTSRGFVELADGTQYVSAPGTSDVEAIFHPVPINSNGTFFGDNVEFTSPTIPIVSQGGSWAGQFSTIEDARGNPRAAAGVNTGFAEAADGSRSVLTGAFYGATERFQ